VSNRTNDVMKVLTMISTIFMPLTFIAGVYGMNFEHMPELQWRYGYFIILGLMTISIILMLMWFRRKKWL
jgi:magnesium transporter